MAEHKLASFVIILPLWTLVTLLIKVNSVLAAML